MRSKNNARIKRVVGKLQPLKPRTKKADFLLFFATFLLTIFGLIMVYDALPRRGKRKFIYP